MSRLPRPLNKEAVEKTDEEFYANHPELVKDGKRQLLDVKNPEQAKLREEWTTLYHKNAKKDKNENENDLSKPAVKPCQKKRGILVAIVKTPSRKPIEGATVEIKDQGWVKLTDKDGIANFGEVPEGNYTVEASKDRYSQTGKFSETKQVQGDTTVVIELQLIEPCCKIEIRATELNSVLGYCHLFIVFTDENGTQYYLRGGPSNGGNSSDSSGLSGGSSHASSRESSNSGSNPSNSSSNSSWGHITTEYGQYLPGTIDYDPQAKTVQVDSCTRSCPKYQILIEEMNKIENAHIVYNPLGPNSNSVVFTALRNIGIIPSLPDNVWAPGYDMPISYE